MYAAKKSLGLVYLQKFRSSTKICRKIIMIIGAVFGLFLIYVYVLNAFLTRKFSAVIHGNKFLSLTE